MYRPLVESLDEILEEDIDPLGALGDVKTFSFAGFSALQEATKVNTLVTPEPEATPTTSLRVDAPVFQPIVERSSKRPPEIHISIFPTMDYSGPCRI